MVLTAPKNIARLIKPMTAISGNAYFSRGFEKDVWTTINDYATDAANSPSNKGREVIRLSQGFFSHAVPEFILEEGRKALYSSMVSQYSPTGGRVSLINSLIKQYSKIYNEGLKKENVLIVTGATEAIYLCLRSLLNPGDEVIVFEPFYEQYITNIELNCATVRYVPIRPVKSEFGGPVAAENWKVDMDVLRSSFNEKTKVLIINTPHNPLGKIFTREELLEIGQLCVENNVYIMADEVYEHLHFKSEVPRMATLSHEIGQLTLSIGSAGKAYAVPGWRIGWIISRNPRLLQFPASAHTRICFASPSPSQEACARITELAMTNGYFEKNVGAYRKKFSILTNVFDELKLPYIVPDGTIFLTVDFSKVRVPDDYLFPTELASRARDFQLSYWLMNELGVVAFPVSAFVSKNTVESMDTFLRFAVSTEDSLLEKAAERLPALRQYIVN